MSYSQPNSPFLGPAKSGKGCADTDQGCIRASGDGTYYILNNNNQPNSTISSFNYTPEFNSSPPINNEILTTDFGVPTISNYISLPGTEVSQSVLAVSSSGVADFVTVSYGGINVNPASNGLYPVTLDSQGRYVRGNELFFVQNLVLYGTGGLGSNAQNPILLSLEKGNRWFITFYNNLTVPIDNDELDPYNNTFTPEENLLASKGVFEIINVANINISNDVRLWLYPKPKVDFGAGWGQDVGFLLWEAKSSGKNEFTLVQNNVNSSGPGCFVDQYTTDEIIQNLTQITKEFGSNKQ